MTKLTIEQWNARYKPGQPVVIRFSDGWHFGITEGPAEMSIIGATGVISMERQGYCPLSIVEPLMTRRTAEEIEAAISEFEVEIVGLHDQAKEYEWECHGDLAASARDQADAAKLKIQVLKWVLGELPDLPR